MGFSPNIREKALIACKRHCVWCGQSQGITIECHHIVPQNEDGPDSFDNCIPLCLNCHGTVGAYSSKHPRGTKISPSELKKRRDMFYESVKKNQIPAQNVHTYSPTIPNKYDVMLFEKIQKVFSQPNLEYYLTDFDLGNDFDNEIFKPLWGFSDMLNNPASVFIDTELEALKLVLEKDVNQFNWYKARNTIQTSLGTQVLKCWVHEKSKKMERDLALRVYVYEERRKMVVEFNDLATKIWTAYSQLIIACRRKLA